MTFQQGKSYRTRCGAFVRITQIKGSTLLGTYRGLTLVWALNGRRIPLGGEDPYDLLDEETVKSEAWSR